MLRQHNSSLLVLLRLVDAGVVYVALQLAALATGHAFVRDYRVAGIIAALIFALCMEAVDAYRPWRGTRLYAEAQAILTAWFFVVGALLLLGWGLKASQLYSRLVVGIWFVAAPFGVVCVHLSMRLFLRILRRRGRNTKTAVIVGAGDLGIRLAGRISDVGWAGITLLGFFDDDVRKTGMAVAGVKVIGPTALVADYVNKHAIDYVYIALPMRSESKMRELFDSLQDTTASIQIVPDIFVFDLLRARYHDIAGIPVVSLCDTPVSGPYGLVKRVEDIVLASLIILITMPLMALIAIGVKLSSPGPVIFKQRRYGLNGKEIKVYKFRSMTVCEDGGNIPQARKCDSRVTRFGAFLRRTSLDELPQFFNVLQGRMSVVGPRPHAVAHNEEYRKLIQGYMWRHKVKPGITGLAQVKGWRGETDTLEKMEKRVECDLDYIRNWSVWLDLKIVALTVVHGFVGRNAY